MGAMAPHFRILPVPPGGVPTNAALLATSHNTWTVRVTDDGRELPTSLHHLHEMTAGAGYVVIRPGAAWPAGRGLELVATLSGSTVTQTFRTAAGPAIAPPACAWNGPIVAEPPAPAIPDGMWPSNMPYRPNPHARSFVLPAIRSATGAILSARVWLRQGRKVSVREGAISEGAAVPGGPSPGLRIDPPYGEKFVSDVKLVGIELTDLAGNTARYGETDGA